MLQQQIIMGCLSDKDHQKKLYLQPSQPNPKLNKVEVQYLTLIYQNLANRSKNKLLNQHNFSLFFELTGLWGDKLFKYFSNNSHNQLALNDFLNGMGKVMRVPFQQKTKILFNFIKNPTDDGISYKQFLKMLYHYSKPQLKQIMTEDGVFIHQAIIPSSTQLQQQKQSGVVEYKHQPKMQQKQQNKLNGQHQYQQNGQKGENGKEGIQKEQANKNLFQKAFAKISQQYQDPGTLLQFKTQKVTYQVFYCNMSALTKQYSSHIFKKYHINEMKQSMNEQQFKDYIQRSKKLFLTYYAVFHEELWGFVNNKPLFLQHIEKQTDVLFSQNNIKRPAHIMLVSDTIIVSSDKNRRQDVIKMITMEGIAVSEEGSNKMILKDQPEGLSTIQIQFDSTQITKTWLQQLKLYNNNYFQNKYEVLQSIGTGKFSVVFKCRQKASKKQYALKILSLEKLTQRQLSAIQNETEVTKILNSPHFAKLYETIFTKKTIYLVSQYIFGEDLFQFVKKKKSIQESEAAFLLGQIIEAVMHLHNMDIIHRDLKPENIMVSYKKVQKLPDEYSPHKMARPKPDKIKIIDFGFANYLSVLQQRVQDCPIGTLGYMAPQLLLGQKPSFQNDVFSIGCILYFMLRGKHPFQSTNPTGTALATVKGDYSLYDGRWEEISDQAKQLVQHFLKTDPNERITLKQALNHRWFISLNNYNQQKQQ